MKIVGIDSRMDEFGDSHPWRIVMADAEDPMVRRQHQVRLPSTKRYISAPRHPLYGDLTIEGRDPSLVYDDLARDAYGETCIVSTDASDMAVRSMIWHGIDLRTTKVHPRINGVADDPYSLGGDAGHQVANIAKTLKGTT